MLARKTPSATVAAAQAASARRYELSDRALIRRRLDACPRREWSERREGHEREEPRNVEVEPMREDELEANHERSRERCQLDEILLSRHEVERGGDSEQHELEDRLDGCQV